MAASRPQNVVRLWIAHGGDISRQEEVYGSVSDGGRYVGGDVIIVLAVIFSPGDVQRAKRTSIGHDDDSWPPIPTSQQGDYLRRTIWGNAGHKSTILKGRRVR